MPVGQAVIATIDFPPPAGLATGPVAGAPLTAPSTRPTTSAAVDAPRSDCTKSGRTSARARLESTFMWSAPAPSGAAIMKTSSAGPSGAPKSTAGRTRAKAMDGSRTAEDRQCGIAIPPGSPVADWASRSRAA